jgi:two-component system cell cycle response regulator CtrA
MRVIVCCPTPSLTESLCMAAYAGGFAYKAEPSIQEFGSQLYRDPDAVGVLWSMGCAGAAESVRRLRQADVRNPLLILVEDLGDPTRAVPVIVSMLGLGADDIQPLPIDDREFVARLAALGRRKRTIDDPIHPLPNGCMFDPILGELRSRDGAIVGLSRQEAKLFEALVTRPGLICTKAMMYLALYEGRADDPVAKIIDVFVCKLRRKIAAITGGLDCIETVWGEGYRFVAEGYAPDARLARREKMAVQA